MSPLKTALVLGASSGIGAAVVAELRRRGYEVAAVARREAELSALSATSGARTYVHDVTHFDGIPKLFERIVGDLNGLGMVVYAAGAMPKITPETWDFALDKQVIDTNLLGLVAWLNCVGPHFQKQRSGTIVGISSIAGDRGRRGFPAYCTSKAAMNTYLEAVRNRLARHGVKVVTIKPGYVDTAMTKGLDKLFWLAPPEKAAAQIADAAERGAHTRYVYRRWAFVGLVIRSIPSFIFRKLDI